MTYLDAQSTVRNALGIVSPGASLLDAWSDFVAECEEGYSWHASEYADALRVRGDIERLLLSKGLHQFSEHTEFVDLVSGVDARFRSLAHPDYQFPNRQSWWETVLPRFAHVDFAESVQAAFGFRLHVV